MGKRVIFYDVTRRLLNLRLDLVEKGETPPFTDMRHLFYECRNLFLRENPQFNAPDSDSETLYNDWEKIVGGWCEKHCADFGVDPTLYWRVREKLNIWPEGRAVCEGESGKFLIDRDTRERASKGCSFILLCEKKTVSRELLKELREKGYKVNLISTGGMSPSDVQEAVMLVAEELVAEDTPTFYILVLHDFDRDGLKIYFNLKERYGGVIDVGVNPELLSYLKERGGFDPRLVEEQVLNKNCQWELRRRIEESGDYTLKDFDYLQGSQTAKKRWVGKRIEIDAIHVQYGIKPFVDYIARKIEEECQVWDMSRIGVEPFELEYAGGHYELTTEEFNEKWQEKYDRVEREIQKPLSEIIEAVESVLSSDKSLAKYRALRNRVEKSVDASLKRMMQHYPDYGKDWSEDYEGELDEINDRIKHYEGDVRKGPDDLSSEAEDLQAEANSAALNDPELDQYEEELGGIDTKEGELKKLEKPDRNGVIRTVIKRLKAMLASRPNS
ncbi:MAG: hypothetical protein HWN51_02245 [Desulfobacterales bacterium]|nr:hypothetical protein [Desulfobacterales bacterium]